MRGVARALGAACAAASVGAGALLACSTGITPDCSDAQCGTPTYFDAQADAAAGDDAGDGEAAASDETDAAGEAGVGDAAGHEDAGAEAAAHEAGHDGGGD